MHWDPLTRIVLANLRDHKRFFSTADGLIRTKNYQGQDVVCVPRENNLITQLLLKVHEIVGHYGDQRTS
jgi:hypothetical protein